MTDSADLHLDEHTRALASIDTARLDGWGRRLAHLLTHGGRLLIAGNGGSAAEAQHLSAELVGRYRHDRRPLPAIALHTDSSTLTALANDFGYAESFSRQVTAHGRPGDVLLVMTTSGKSANVLAAIDEAHALGLSVWAMTGPAPNPTAAASDETIAIDAATPHVQECHLVAVHLLCEAIDAHLNVPRRSAHASSHPQIGTLVVIGDALLDETLTGDVYRVSPEAPVPVVARPERQRTPGGAALAAALAAENGNAVTLITALSDDQDAAIIRDRLETAGVSVINLGTDAPTATKTRIRSREQTVLMLDHATPAAPPHRMSDAARSALSSASAVLVSDYGRGIAADETVRAELAGLAGRVPIVWDPHARGPAPVPGTTMVTPNQAEAAHFATALALHEQQGGTTSDPAGDVRAADVHGRDGLARDVTHARALREAWCVQHVALTRGKDGVVLIGAGGPAPLVIPAHTSTARDSCGAGDSFAADLIAQLAAGVLPSLAVAHAVRAAGEFVTRGTRRREPARQGAAPQTFAGIRAAGGTVVATGGCFDLLHRGHIAMLQQARALGDHLVVCINSDASVTRRKGEPRPLTTADDRAAVLMALASVDEVLVFEEDTPEQILTRIQPDIFVKGGDYALDDLPERAVVEAHAGQVVLVPYLDGRSTTTLITRATTGSGLP